MKAGAMVGVSAGPAVKNWDFHAVLDEYTRRWSQFIREQAQEDRPFFLYASMPSPHTPIAPHESFQGKSKVSPYADFLVQTDFAVGEILRALRESGQADNTLVIFTCDNGTSPKADFPGLDRSGIHLNVNWRGWKADAYEGGHRVPFIARWPGKIQPGTRSDQTITLADIMATCADVLEHSLPANAGEDSVSLLPTLTGKTSGGPLHEMVVHHSVSGHFAVRRGKWKLLFCQGSGGWSPPREAVAAKQKLPPVQLYDLSMDPQETTNLQSQYPDIVQQLTNDLRRLIERGRSNPGPKQVNHGGQIWWPGLPWPKPKALQPEPAKMRLLKVKRIWDRAPHNAFTDLTRFNDRWFCVFREGRSHVSPDGALRVIASDDGEQWESVALIESPTSDLRDAKITQTPDGRLMLSGAEAINQPKTHRHQSLCWFSDDGRQWSKPVDIGMPDNWLWRVTWHRGKAYGFGYGCRSDNRGIRLFQSDDGKSFETLIPKSDVKGTYPNETSLVFRPDGMAICLLRQDGEPNSGFLGTAEPPYKSWTWKSLGTRIGGPHLIQLPDGRLIAAVRLYDGQVRTSLCWLDRENATLKEALKLPSSGDTSYAGLVWHDDRLWVSYYSAHESGDTKAKTSIYLAKVAIE